MSLSRVVVVRAPGLFAPDGTARSPMVERLYAKGLQILTGAPGAREALASLFSSSERIGIKVNGIAGRRLTTTPEISLPLAGLLVQAGANPRNITIWDRTNRELKDAGYKLNAAGEAYRIMGTDAAGMGYAAEPLEHRSIGSRFSAVLTNAVDASISLAVLKDHGLAGVTAGMKNYFGAIHNPNKYHDDHCDPFIAEVFDAPPVKSRHRLTILDALQVQYHRGPSFHVAWAARRETMIFSLDPVAADHVGWKLVEELRKAKGLPTLAEDGRPPSYLKSAERLGLGRASDDGIQILEDSL
jgi:uncharacterized protein (DUF362 family)